jgi:hypothetical protein
MARRVTHPIERRLRQWQKKLLLQDWKITVLVGALDEHDEKADCDAKPQYREALIRLDPEKIPAPEWDAFCVHELLHVITWRLEALAEEWGRSESQYVVARDAAETVVTDLERIILKLVGK